MRNYGVWARFAFALNSTSDYVCVFDDDTIPSEKWFENCINCIENENNGLYGTIGVTFNDLDYHIIMSVMVGQTQMRKLNKLT